MNLAHPAHADQSDADCCHGPPFYCLSKAKRVGQENLTADYPETAEKDPVAPTRLVRYSVKAIAFFYPIPRPPRHLYGEHPEASWKGSETWRIGAVSTSSIMAETARSMYIASGGEGSEHVFYPIPRPLLAISSGA